MLCPRCRHASALTNNATAAFAHKRVVFIGDSLAEQLYAAFNCLAQNMAPSLPRPAHVQTMPSYTYDGLMEPSLGIGPSGAPGGMLRALRQFDVIVIEIGSHYHAWEFGNFTSELHTLLEHEGLRRMCLQRACVLASPPASHFVGGMESPHTFLLAQGECRAHKFEEACGGEQDANFPGSHGEQQKTLLQATAASARRHHGEHPFAVLALFSLTQRWPELHPGYRRNRHDKLCDCLHYCYDERMWEPVFASLARVLSLSSSSRAAHPPSLRPARAPSIASSPWDGRKHANTDGRKHANGADVVELASPSRGRVEEDRRHSVPGHEVMISALG